MINQVYAWCICGYSKNQPLCDGSHLQIYLPKKMTSFRPVRFIPGKFDTKLENIAFFADKDMEVWFCNCKQTKNRPFCDGSHKDLDESRTANPLSDDF